MLPSSARSSLYIVLVLVLDLQPVYSATLSLASRSVQRVFVQRNHGFRINCSAKGDPEPFITWIKDGMIIMPTRKRRIEQNGGLYFVDGVSDFDVGTFQCRSSNAAGVLLGKKVELELIYLKNISLTVSRPASGARLKCNVLSNQPVRFTWLKNGKILDPKLDSRLTELPNGVLQIQDYKLSDDGLYSCRAKNYCEEVNSSVITVSGKASNKSGLEIYPRKVVSTTVGSRLVIECVQFGSNASNLSWTKMLSPSSNDSVLVTGTSFVNLVVDAVQLSHGGEYVCRQVGGREEKVVVTVKAPPSFVTVLPSSMKLIVGDNLKLKCGAKGSPAPRITWYRNGQSLVGDDRVILSGDLLQVNNLTMTDGGVYQCEAENDLGSSLNYIVLDVTDKPLPRIDVYAYPLSSSKINVTWSSTLKSKARDIYYSVHYRAVVDIPEIQHIPLNRAMFYTIKYLKAFTEYVIYVQMYSSGQNTIRQSNIIRVTTQEKVPSGPPLYVSLKSYTYGTLDITWLPPKLRERNGLVTGYNITYFKKGVAATHVAITGKDVYTLTLKNLEGNYLVKVAAKTKIGCGPFSAQKSAMVSAVLPAKVVLPAPIITTLYANPSVIVSVKRPIMEDVTGYLLTYRNILDKAEHNKKVVINGGYFIQKLSDLKLNSEYVIYVSATGGTDYGRPAVVVMATKRQLPKGNDTEANTSLVRILPPMGITCQPAHQSTALVLKWQPPPFTHATKYHITYFVEDKPNERKDMSTSDLNATVTGLLPGRVYEVEITSSVRYGLEKKYVSQKGKPDRRCYLPEQIPGSPPSNVTCHADPPSRIVVKWREPARANGHITQYRIRWSDTTGKHREEVIQALGFLRVYTKYLTNVRKDAKYTLFIYGLNSAGRSPEAQCSVDTTMVKDITTQPPVGSKNNHHSTQDDDIRLGIIIGCIISLLFVVLLALFVVWSDPCGCRSHKPLRPADGNALVRTDGQTKNRVSKPDTISTEVSDASSKHYQILQKYFFEEASKESDRGLSMTPKNSRLCLDNEKVPFLQKTPQNDYSADGSFDSQDSGIQGFNKLDKGSSSSTTIKETQISPRQSDGGVGETVC